jgi:hypothetical protein
MAGKLRGKSTVATLSANKRQALANKPRALPNTRLAWAEKLNDQVWPTSAPPQDARPTPRRAAG